MPKKPTARVFIKVPPVQLEVMLCLENEHTPSESAVVEQQAGSVKGVCEAKMSDELTLTLTLEATSASPSKRTDVLEAVLKKLGLKQEGATIVVYYGD